jgi:hypothetical protein
MLDYLANNSFTIDLPRVVTCRAIVLGIHEMAE